MQVACRLKRLFLQLTFALTVSSSQNMIIGSSNDIDFFMARVSIIITKCCSQSVTLRFIDWNGFCVFSYLVIWDDDSNDNDENRRKRWHCVISWLSNHKCVWTTTAIFVKNLQSFLSISVIWHAILSFMGIQKQFPKGKKEIKLIMEAIYVMLM